MTPDTDLCHVRRAAGCVSAERQGCLVASPVAATAAIALYDPETRIGGLLHWVVPTADADPKRAAANPAISAETGIPWILGELEQAGAHRNGLRVVLVGGASLIAPDDVDLGHRNRVAARRMLREAGIEPESEGTGGRGLRELVLHLSDGRFEVRPLGETPEKV